MRCVPQTATTSLAVEPDIFAAETDTDESADDSGIVLDETPVVSVDTADNDTKVESTEGGTTAQSEDGDGFALSEVPTVNPDKANGDEHAISFDVDETRVTLSDNADKFAETESADGTYTFKAEVTEGYKITSVSLYKDSEKKETLAENETEWTDVTPVATWTESTEDTDTISYAADTKTYSISEENLTGTKSDGTTQETFTIVIESEQTTFNVTVTLSDTEKSNITSWTYGIDDAEVTTEGTFGTAIPVPYGSTLKIKLTPAANCTATVKVGSSDTATEADADGVYTFANITAATTITVSTTETNPEEYTVVEDIQDEDGGPSRNATIVYTDDCVAEGKIQKDTDLTFKVETEKGYTATVKYKIGNGGSENSLTPKVGTGVYTIVKGEIAFDAGTGEDDKKVTIIVTVAKTEYTITFNKEGATGAEVKVIKDNTPADPETDGEIVGYGDTLTFTVNPGKSTVGGNEVANKLRYVNTRQSADGAMEAKSVAEGVYTFEYTVDDTTGENTTIYISATPAGDITLRFDGAEENGETQVDISIVTGAGTTESPYALETVTDTATAKEDSKALFVVEPKSDSMYTVESVHLQGSEEAAATKEITIGTGEDAKTYTAYEIDLTDAAETITVVIELALDESKANIVTFTVNGNDIGNAFTVEIAGEEYHAGQSYKTAQADITFSILANAGYELNGIVATWTDKEDKTRQETLNEIEDDDEYDDWKTYRLTFDAATNKRDVTIKVDASVRAVKNDTTVSFNKVSDGVHSYEVTETETVTNRTGNIYDLKQGAQIVEFTVFALEDYTPAVSYEGWDEWGNAIDIPVDTPAPGESTTKGTGRAQVTVYPYTYSVPAAVLGSEGVITIDAKSATRNLEIYYEFSDVEIQVTPVIEPDENDTEFQSVITDGDKVVGERYKVPVKSDVTITFEASKNCGVTKASYKIGDAVEKSATAKELNAGAFKVSNVTADTRVDITTYANYAVEVRPVVDAQGATGEVLELVKNAYSVDYTGQYQISVIRGADPAPIKISTAAVTKTNAGGETTAEVTSDNNAVNLKLSAKDAGQSVEVTLTIGDGGSEDATITLPVVKFSVLPVITSLTISGIKLTNGKGTLDQDADSKKEYSVTMKPAGANMDKLSVQVLPEGNANPTEADIAAAKAIADAAFEDGKLTITTKPQKDADIADLGKVLVQLVDTNLNAGDEGYVKADITVTVTAPSALKDTTPTVSVKSSTDTTLTLTLGLGKNAKVVEPEAGELWYQVTVTADETYNNESLTDNVAISAAVGTFYIKKAASTTQDATLKVSNADLGGGKAWGYKVTDVKLVQFVTAMDGLQAEDPGLANNLMLTTVNTKVEVATISEAAAKIAFESKAANSIDAATRTPYYETKLKLKKGKTTVYTGQRVAIATLQFNDDTTYKTARAVDVSYYPNNYDSGSDNLVDDMVKLEVLDGTVYMTVADCYEYDEFYYNAPITGSHTIRVTAKGPDDIYPVSADIKVTVVRGINALTIVPASSVIYKATGKAATLKVTPVYNEDYTGKNKTAQPKTKKLSYELVQDDWSGSSYENPYVKINAANGTVTIDKRFVVDDSNNTFVIKATATDFEGNNTYGYSDEITISANALEIGRVEILQEEWEPVYDEDGYEEDWIAKYRVVAKAGSEVTSDELLNGNVQVVAFRPGAPEKLIYSNNDMNRYAIYPDGILSFTSNNKAVTVDKTSGYITGVSKVANNVTITATANDGGKKKASMKFNVVNAEPAFIGLHVEQQNDDASNYYQIFEDGMEATEAGQRDITVNGTADTVLSLSLIQKAEAWDNWVYAYQFANIKMTVTGGKVLQKADAFNRGMLIIANKETIKVTLENKSVKPSVKQTYVITNKAAANSLTSFQKVTTTTKALAAYSTNGQEIIYKLNARDISKCAYTDEKDQLYVMVRSDAADRYKKYSQYSALEERSGVNGTQPVEKDGTFKLWFDNGDLPTGTYKLQLTFGKIGNHTSQDNNGSFIAESKPQTVTLKINANKTKVTFKPATTLTMSLKDKASAALTGTGKNYDSVRFHSLQNINGYGTSNNEEQFTTYFVLINSNTISLKDDLTEDQLAFITDTSKSNKKAQNARTAYISYVVENSNREIASNIVSGTVKITVKFTGNDKNGNLKPAASYSMTSSVILEGNKSTEINVTASKQPADIAYAAVSDKGDGNFAIDPGRMYIGGDSVFTLSSENDPLAVNTRGYTVKVKVVPADAHGSFLNKIASAKNAYQVAMDDANATTEAKTQAADNYRDAILNSDAAIELTTTVKVFAKSASVKKIAIATSELNRTTWNYSGNKDKNYWNHVYYTKATDIDIYDITVKSTTTGFENLVSFGYEPGDTWIDDGSAYFDICVNKDALAAAEAAQQAKGANKHAYGTKIKVTATISYTKWESQEGSGYKPVKDEEVQTDEFTFNVTLPKKPETNNFTETLDKVKAATADAKFYDDLYASQDYPGWSQECNGYPFGGYEFGEDDDSWTLYGPSDDNWDEWYEEQVEWGNQKEADLYGYINGALWQVYDAIYAMAPEDSDTSVEMIQHWNDIETITLSYGDFVAPTSTTDGKLIIRVRLTDSTIYTEDEWGDRVIAEGYYDEDDDGNQIVKAGYREVLPIELKIPKTGEQPGDIADILEAYVTNAQNNKTYAKMPTVDYDDIIADICKTDGEVAAALNQYPTLRFNIEEPYEIYCWDDDWNYVNYYYAQPREWIKDNLGYSDDEMWDIDFSELDEAYKFYTTDTDEDGEEFRSYLTEADGWRREPNESAAGYIAGVLHVWGIKYGGEEVRIPFIFTLDKLDGLTTIESNIKWALGDKTTIADAEEEELKERVKLTPSNNTTKEEIETIFKAAYANPMVEADWGELTGIAADAEDKGFQLDQATKDAEGSIRCAIKLSQEDADDKTFEVEIEIPALIAATDAVNEVRKAVIGMIEDEEGAEELAVKSLVRPIIDQHLKTIATAEELPDALKATIVSEVNEAVLKAANDALAGQPYTVVYQKAANGTDDVFALTPYTYKNDGTISYTLEVRELTKGLNGDSDVTVGDLVTDGTLPLKDTDGEGNEITDIPLKHDLSLMTFPQAAGEIRAALDEMDDVNNATDSEAVCEAASNAIQALEGDEYGDVPDISVSHKQVEGDDDWVDDCTFIPATFTKEGSLTGTLILSRWVYDESAGDEDDPDEDFNFREETYEYEYTVELPMLTKNDETVVKTEIARALQAIGVTNADAGEETAENSGVFKLKEEKEAALIAEAVRVVNDSGYEVEHNTDKASTLTKATINATGAVTISFILKAATVAEGETPATVSGDGKFDNITTISKLAQDVNALKNAINAVLAEKYPDNQVTLPTGTTDANEYCETLAAEILTAVTAADVMKDTYTIVWDTDNALTAVTENVDGTDTVTGYKGRLNIYKANNKGQQTGKVRGNVDVTLTIAAATTLEEP